MHRKPIILFGSGKIAEVIYYFFSNFSDREVKAIILDKEYIDQDKWNDLPVIDFANVVNIFPPDQYEMFIALGYQDINKLRENKYLKAKSLGYKMASYIHPNSGIPTDLIYGENCFIMNNVMIHPKVELGNNIFVWTGAMIGHHSIVSDNCWLTSSSNISGGCTLGKNCFFAVNSTIGHSVTVGNYCFFGANTLITKCCTNNSVFLCESTKKLRLNTQQFLHMSNFSDL